MDVLNTTHIITISVVLMVLIAIAFIIGIRNVKVYKFRKFIINSIDNYERNRLDVIYKVVLENPMDEDARYKLNNFKNNVQEYWDTVPSYNTMLLFFWIPLTVDNWIWYKELRSILTTEKQVNP